jgi:alkylation response protein AidB-like acyl-CoA dehydrogenase
MDFDDKPDEAQFRAEVRTFLERHATRKRETSERLSQGAPDANMVRRAREWQAVKAEHGFASIQLPKRWGGREGKPIEQVIYNQEEGHFDVPRGVFEVTLGMCIPTLLSYAEQSVIERYVSPALRGEEIWCQLFSEPSAGSDLGALRTRATRDGDGWIVSGQKIWTSHANIANFGLLLVRTDTKAAKHAGLTAFFVDMHSPGIEVRPIKRISGDHSFNEVFFDNVRVPDSQRLGAVGEGWSVALTTLSHERLAIAETSGPTLADIFRLCSEVPIGQTRPIENEAVRAKLADWYVQTEGVKYTRYRVMTALSRGQKPGPEASVAKAVNAKKLQEIASLALDLMGPAAIVSNPELARDGGLFQDAYLYAPGKRIAGGTDEILRNIIAERVLGLPGDLRVDRNVPFDEIPTAPPR